MWRGYWAVTNTATPVFAVAGVDVTGWRGGFDVAGLM